MKARYMRLLGYFVYSLPFGILYAFPVFKGSTVTTHLIHTVKLTSCEVTQVLVKSMLPIDDFAVTWIGVAQQGYVERVITSSHCHKQ